MGDRGANRLPIVWLVCACQGCPHNRLALRAGFLLAAPPLTVLAKPGVLLVRISRRDLWPDQETSGELNIITGFQESGEARHRAGMSFVYPLVETFSPKPVSSYSNWLPYKDEWF